MSRFSHSINFEEVKEHHLYRWVKVIVYLFRTWCSMKRSGPDSLDSWIAAAWCNFVGMVLFAMVRLSGMLFVASMEEFDADRQRASLPYILCDFTQALMGPVTGYCASKLGTRPVLMFGCLLSAVGIGCNFFATSIGTVTILWGVVFGIGFGCCCPLLPIIITQHFVKKRATAIGFMYVGSYLGMSILPAVLEYLINNYGLRGTFLWLAGMMLHCVPAIMLLRNPGINKLTAVTENSIANGRQINNHPNGAEKYVTRKVSFDDPHSGKIIGSENIETRKIAEHITNAGTGNFTIKKRNSLDTSNNLKVSSNSTQNIINELPKVTSSSELAVSPYMRDNTSSKCKLQIGHDTFPITSCLVLNSKFMQSSCKMTFPDIIEDSHLADKYSEMFIPKDRRISIHKMKPSAAFKVFFEPIFVLVLLLNAIFMCSFIAFVTIVVDFAEDIGLMFTDGKYIILGFSIASNIGLLSFGWVTDSGYLSVTNFSGIIYFVRAVTLATMPFCKGFSTFLCIVMVQGLSEAPLGNLLPLITAEYYSEDVHEVAISCSYILCGPIHLAIPSIISYFRDGLGSYNYMFYSMSAASLLCSVLLFMAPILAKCRCVKDERILRNRNSPEPTVTA